MKAMCPHVRSGKRKDKINKPKGPAWSRRTRERAVERLKGEPTAMRLAGDGDGNSEQLADRAAEKIRKLSDSETVRGTGR